MGRCKEIELKVIPASIAVPFVKAHHYSGKVVNNSLLHFGAFLDGKLHGGGAEAIVGYQPRYIYFIDPKYRKRLTVPEIPFTAIDEMGAGMYKGENVRRDERHVECEAQKERNELNKQPTTGKLPT